MPVIDFDALQVLVYKMTHPGDPEPNAGERFNAPAWGRQDCMGEIRARSCDAVIGVGGIGREPKSHSMDGKVQWIGIGPRPWPSGPRRRGPVLTFDRYLWFGVNGPSFTELAPHLAARLLVEDAPRHVMSFSAEERQEVSRILGLARDADPSHPASGAPPEVPPLDAGEKPCSCGASADTECD